MNNSVLADGKINKTKKLLLVLVDFKYMLYLLKRIDRSLLNAQEENAYLANRIGNAKLEILSKSTYINNGSAKRIGIPGFFMHLERALGRHRSDPFRHFALQLVDLVRVLTVGEVLE